MEITVPVAAVTAPLLLTGPATPILAAFVRARFAPIVTLPFTIALAADRARVPGPSIAPARLAAPVRVKVSPAPIVRVVPAAVENAPA